VDAVSSAISDAHQNARHNGIENAEFFAMDATEYMQRIAGRNKGGEGGAAARINEDLVVIMDPPRAGSTEEFLRAAAALKPARIVYVSCNPQTQIRDVEILEKLGYFTVLVQPVDMFPHTPHIETIALIEPAK
jgi:23S rRNA (uracil1939-C5)-methyltransferase